MIHLNNCELKNGSGYTILEVIVAIFIFGCISTAIFYLLAQTEKIHGRALFVDGAVRLASIEAERIRSMAARNVQPEDSSYIQTFSGRKYRVLRTVIKPDLSSPFQHKKYEPIVVELTVSDEVNVNTVPLRFKLMTGQDNP